MTVSQSPWPTLAAHAHSASFLKSIWSRLVFPSDFEALAHMNTPLPFPLVDVFPEALPTVDRSDTIGQSFTGPDVVYAPFAEFDEHAVAEHPMLAVFEARHSPILSVQQRYLGSHPQFLAQNRSLCPEVFAALLTYCTATSPLAAHEPSRSSVRSALADYAPLACWASVDTIPAVFSGNVSQLTSRISTNPSQASLFLSSSHMGLQAQAIATLLDNLMFPSHAVDVLERYTADDPDLFAAVFSCFNGRLTKFLVEAALYVNKEAFLSLTFSRATSVTPDAFKLLLDSNLFSMVSSLSCPDEMVPELFARRSTVQELVNTLLIRPRPPLSWFSHARQRFDSIPSSRIGMSDAKMLDARILEALDPLLHALVYVPDLLTRPQAADSSVAAGTSPVCSSFGFANLDQVEDLVFWLSAEGFDLLLTRAVSLNVVEPFLPVLRSVFDATPAAAFGLTSPSLDSFVNLVVESGNLVSTTAQSPDYTFPHAAARRHASQLAVDFLSGYLSGLGMSYCSNPLFADLLSTMLSGYPSSTVDVALGLLPDWKSSFSELVSTASAIVSERLSEQAPGWS